MIVCAHCVSAEVERFCENHEMRILESYAGKLDDYEGRCAVIVTSEEMTRQEYDDMKCLLFGRGYELVSTTWTDDEVIVRLLHNQIEQLKKRGGRQRFGYYKRNGIITVNPEKIKVAQRVIQLRDRGLTLREISYHKDVVKALGRELSISTVQVIIKNREIYEHEEIES